ncbi:type II toxin-antitoxin system VapC family toxin [Candidatus Acetothermia bacterium]|nr:type II toxin-antitoxin system VapC family toxin [Candidatus Acetothermia bacterium]
MVHFYLDTSAIIKRYHQEIGSEVLDKILDSKAEKGLVTSYWAVLEFMGALSCKVERKELSKKAMGVAVASFLKELTDRFTVRSVNDELVAKALPMGLKYCLSSGDCLHLATTLELKKIFEEAEDQLVFICADDDLCKAAKKEKVEAINPRDGDALKLVEKLLPDME